MTCISAAERVKLGRRRVKEGEQVEASSLLLSLHSPLLHSLLAERDKLEVTAVTMPLPASGLRTLVALLSSG